MGSERGNRVGALVVASLILLLSAAAALKPRAIVIVPFDAMLLDREEQWMGEGIAQLLSLGLAQHPAFIQIERARLRAFDPPEAWGEAAVGQAVRGIHADVGLFGRVIRRGTELVIEPRLIQTKPGSGDPASLDPVPVPEGQLLARAATLPGLYARALGVALTDGERARMEKAARPTISTRAFELFSRAQMTLTGGGQEHNEAAAELLSRAVETDPNFVVAHYILGTVHQALGNRWKAAAQFRASTQLDPSYAEPYKALGDLFLAAPRRLYDQAVEAYSKAIELRPFYAEAFVGLGDAKAAKGEVDGAVAAYQKALVFNPITPRVHLSLGKIYYAEKGLYYESVTAYKRALELDPRSVEARMGLGEVYEDKGLYREAIEEYRRVIDIDSQHTGAMYNLASVYEKVDPREAIVQWERYISLASQLPAEKDWVDVARQHLRKLRNRVPD